MALSKVFNIKFFTSGSYSSFVIIFLSILFLSSCGSVKNLQDGDYVLRSAKIKINAPQKVENETGLKYELNSFLKQSPIRKKFWNPRDWFDRNEPLIYDEELTKITADEMLKYLRNKKGYYHATIDYRKKTDRSYIDLVYHIEAGPRYKIRSIDYISSDKKMIATIDGIKDESFVKVGQYLDAATFELEKTRLTNELQNRGYLQFNANYIGLEGDSTNTETDVRFVILPPLPDSVHKQFTVGDVKVYTEHFPSDEPQIGTTKTLDKKSFYGAHDKIIVRPSTLVNEIYLTPGELYSKSDRQKTFRSLSDLSTYRYVSINPQQSNPKDSIIDFNIFLSPNRSKWVADFGSDLFYSTSNSPTFGQNRLIGVSANTSFTNRNWLGGSEKYVLDLESALEVNISGLGINSYSFNVNNYVELPRYTKFFGMSPVLDVFGKFKPKRYQNIKEEANTIINLGYNYNARSNQLTTRSINFSWGYDYKPNLTSRYTINQVGFNYVTTDIKPEFDTILVNNIDLRKRLEPTLFTGLLFKNMSYVYQGPKNRAGRSFGFVSKFELSGLETFLSNEIVNTFSGKDTEWMLGNVNFSKFIKAEVDGRIYKDISAKSSFAARANLGIVLPFGRDTLVPYVKQFYVGGPNSIRAWQIRELGPGGYDFSSARQENNQPFFQTGDIKMEFNLEYRFDMFWYVEGAFFLDAGNVWNLRNSTETPNSKFGTDFLDQFALGLGYGLRFDFTYFIIRFDFGYKLRNSFPDPETGERWVLFNNKYNPSSNLYLFNYPFGNINIAINYPF